MVSRRTPRPSNACRRGRLLERLAVGNASFDRHAAEAERMLYSPVKWNSPDS
jgi:hypothetical protein